MHADDPFFVHFPPQGRSVFESRVDVMQRMRFLLRIERAQYKAEQHNSESGILPIHGYLHLMLVLLTSARHLSCDNRAAGPSFSTQFPVSFEHSLPLLAVQAMLVVKQVLSRGPN
jgi:hypothetical protein